MIHASVRHHLKLISHDTASAPRRFVRKKSGQLLESARGTSEWLQREGNHVPRGSNNIRCSLSRVQPAIVPSLRNVRCSGFVTQIQDPDPDHAREQWSTALCPPGLLRSPCKWSFVDLLAAAPVRNFFFQVEIQSRHLRKLEINPRFSDDTQSSG